VPAGPNHAFTACTPPFSSSSVSAQYSGVSTSAARAGTWGEYKGKSGSLTRNETWRAKLHTVAASHRCSFTGVKEIIVVEWMINAQAWLLCVKSSNQPCADVQALHMLHGMSSMLCRRIVMDAHDPRLPLGRFIGRYDISQIYQYKQ